MVGDGGGAQTPEDILNDPNVDQQIKDVIKPYTCLYNGDVEQDRDVDINDYNLLKNALSGNYKIEELCKCNADVNEDKSINKNDLNLLYNHLQNPSSYPLKLEGECEKLTTSSPSPTPSSSSSPYY